MYLKTIKFIITFFAASAVLFAGDSSDNYPLVKAVVKPDKATVGDLLEYRVNIAGKIKGNIDITPPEKREVFPEKKKEDEKNEESEPLPGDQVPLYIIHSVKKNDRTKESITDITVVIQVSYYRPGKYYLPDLDIKGPDGVKLGYKVPEVEIKGVNEKGEFQPVEPPINLEGNYYRLIFLILGVIAFTFLAVFIFWFVQKRMKGRVSEPVIVPPIDVFMEDVRKLNGRSLISKGQIDDYVFGISMIFRRFLSLLLKIDATEMTSEELEKVLIKLFPKNLYKKYESGIVQGFHLWDLSKFAEFTPSEDILKENLKNTIKLATNLSREMRNGTDRV